MISKRSLLSLCEYLSLQPRSYLRVLLAKHDICEVYDELYQLEDIVNVIENSGPHKQQSLLSEIVRTGPDLRSRVTPRYRYDVRRDDLARCLLLDGYRAEGHQLVAVDPTVSGAEQLDDDLTELLRVSSFPGANQVIAMLNKSADAFRRDPADLNACLADARVALETATKEIAIVRGANPEGFGKSPWGKALEYLRKSDFITQREEQGLAGVYTFTSEGAHSPLGADEFEMARLGRSFIIGMLYFLVKLYTDGDRD